MALVPVVEAGKDDEKIDFDRLAIDKADSTVFLVAWPTVWVWMSACVYV